MHLQGYWNLDTRDRLYFGHACIGAIIDGFCKPTFFEIVNRVSLFYIIFLTFKKCIFSSFRNPSTN